MKKLLLVLCVVLGAGAVSAQSKLAHLNSTQIMEGMPAYKDAVQKLSEFEKAGYEELQVMQADFQSAVEKYQADVASGTMSPVLQKIAEDNLQKKEAALMERQKSLQAEMQAYSQELNAPILQAVQNAVKKISDKHSYDYVLDATMLMIANGPDITDEVIEELLKSQPKEVSEGNN